MGPSNTRHIPSPAALSANVKDNLRCAASTTTRSRRRQATLRSWSADCPSRCDGQNRDRSGMTVSWPSDHRRASWTAQLDSRFPACAVTSTSQTVGGQFLPLGCTLRVCAWVEPENTGLEFAETLIDTLTSASLGMDNSATKRGPEAGPEYVWVPHLLSTQAAMEIGPEVGVTPRSKLTTTRWPRR
jgi:hypothetical protein